MACLETLCRRCSMRGLLLESLPGSEASPLAALFCIPTLAFWPHACAHDPISHLCRLSEVLHRLACMCVHSKALCEGPQPAGLQHSPWTSKVACKSSMGRHAALLPPRRVLNRKQWLGCFQVWPCTCSVWTSEAGAGLQPARCRERMRLTMGRALKESWLPFSCRMWRDACIRNGVTSSDSAVMPAQSAPHTDQWHSNVNNPMPKTCPVTENMIVQDKDCPCPSSKPCPDNYCFCNRMRTAGYRLRGRTP
jgi:hypothetical protein